MSSHIFLPRVFMDDLSCSLVYNTYDFDMYCSLNSRIITRYILPAVATSIPYLMPNAINPTGCFVEALSPPALAAAKAELHTLRSAGEGVEFRQGSALIPQGAPTEPALNERQRWKYRMREETWESCGGGVNTAGEWGEKCEQNQE